MNRKFLAVIFTVSMLCIGQIIPQEKKSKFSLDYPFEVVLECDSDGNSNGFLAISTDSNEGILIDEIQVNSEKYCL